MYRFIFLLISLLFLASCGAPTIHNPSATIKEIGLSPKVHIRAMEMLDSSVGVKNKQYHDQLHRMLFVPGYTNTVREEALRRLWNSDKEGTIRTIRQQLPRLNNWSWLTTLSKWVADEHIDELNEALISSWAKPSIFVKTEQERPEFLALERMYGDEKITELIFETMLASKKTWKQGYRTRCWELLHRLGYRKQLISLLEKTKFDDDDLFFLDLQRAKNDLGIVPRRREEILWIRELSKPKYDSFWIEAIEALSKLDNERRDTIEMRDIPISVSLLRHGGKNAFDRSTNKIINQVANEIKNERHYFETEGGGQYDARTELLRTHRDSLTWGDAVTLEILLTALRIPEVKAHLFDYALRDNQDTTTEYGGVITLDKKGRFEILEFEPKVRTHDRRFNASQNMFDAAYTALFHFHFHAQKIRNGDHAGPGLGDKYYADNTRANCLVFTFVDEKTMNVDYYRHGGIVVDVGTITR
jgi:hypothetical protein